MLLDFVAMLQCQQRYRRKSLPLLACFRDPKLKGIATWMDLADATFIYLREIERRAGQDDVDTCASSHENPLEVVQRLARDPTGARPGCLQKAEDDVIGVACTGVRDSDGVVGHCSKRINLVLRWEWPHFVMPSQQAAHRV